MGAAPTPQPASGSQFNTTQIVQALCVALFGAIGGLLFWVLGKYSGNVPKQIVGWPWYGQVSALMFMSAIAGLFGVYLLTASQVPAIRTFMFAIVCGLLWQPIIDQAQKSAGNILANQQTHNVDNQTGLLKAASSSGSPEQVKAAVGAAVPTVTQAIKTLSQVQGAPRSEELINSSQKAINEFQAAASEDPDSSVGALKDVGIVASQEHHTALALHAIRSLQEVGMSATKPGVVNESIASLHEVADKSDDPDVKKAALNSSLALETSKAKPQ
ncbi:MAG TPA: hypothetical protein VJW20_12430 [Candidatus Angelobacter sp.]|nr:hypothetical protein [Candidatus Angelobacter sp.]